MKTADVVIGANYGDEGKGLVTDFRARACGGEAVVVRFNGGAQAGHTVVDPDGRRHVFSHFGSGSFAGASTFLSRFFVCNPLLFAKEHALLRGRGVSPAVFADEAAPVTTPYEMMLNQIAEEMRGSSRHGSCGVGFGETVGRQEGSGPSLVCGDLKDKTALRGKLRLIREEWVPRRLSTLGITVLPDVWRARFGGEGVEKKFLDDADFFLQQAKVVSGSFLGRSGAHVVFEGAQGLLLDQARGAFPHVTRSHTGIRNVLELAQEAGIGALRVTYATRAYLTRHGAGPLQNELDGKPYARISDPTNVPNPYQGTLRFAWLDLDVLRSAIRLDLSDNKSLRLAAGVCVSCLDQVDDTVSFVADGTLRHAEQGAFLSEIGLRTEAGFLLASRGTSHIHVSDI